MPKRPFYLQSSTDNSYRRRTRRDIEFLCDYWDRLLGQNQAREIRFPELLRANHLAGLSPLLAPLNPALRIDVNFTILDANEPYTTNASSYYAEACNHGTTTYRLPCCNDTSRRAGRNHQLLEHYVRQMSENYAAIERELIRARALASVLECDTTARRHGVFYGQHGPTRTSCHWNKFRPSCARVASGSQEKHVGAQDKSNDQACGFIRREGHDGGANRDARKDSSTRQKRNSYRSYADPALLRNQCSAMIKQNLQESMDACQESIGESINDVTETQFPPAKGSLSRVKPNDDDDGAAINNESPSVDSQPNFALDETRRADEGERGSKLRKLDDVEDGAIDHPDPRETPNRDHRVKCDKDTPTIFFVQDKRLSPKRRVRESPKYANFLGISRDEEETDGQFCVNPPSSRKTDRRNRSQCQSEQENQILGSEARRMQNGSPRSAIHGTEYNPITCSPATDSILDPNELTIQLLRMAILLYAPALMPVLNALIAQQNQRNLVSAPLKGSNNLLMRIFQLLSEQRFIPNLSFTPMESETIDTTVEKVDKGGSRGARSSEEEEKEENTSIAAKEFAAVSKAESVFDKTRTSSHLRKQNEKTRKWRVVSMLADPDVKLDEKFFTILGKDLGKNSEFLICRKKRPEKLRSLSTRGKNEIVRKEHFRVWLHQLLQRLNTADITSTSKDNGETKESSTPAACDSDDQKSSCSSTSSVDPLKSLPLKSSHDATSVADRTESPNENSLY